MMSFGKNPLTAASVTLFTLLGLLPSVCDAGGGEGEGYEFIVHVYYTDIYNILVFLFAAYVAGLATKALGMPALVGEIITGCLLGPAFADFVPFSEALVLIGEIGLIFLLLEAGIELDLTQLRQTGMRAIAIALTGSILPIAAGVAVVMIYDSTSDLKEAIAVGFAFAPTSLAVASTALSGGDVTNTPIGQLIMAACVLSDIIGLVLLSLFEVLVKEDPKVIEYIIPILSSFGFVIVLGLAAVLFLSRFIETKFLPMFSKKNRNMAMFGLLFAMGMGYLPLMYYTKASYLGGAFLVGMTFSLVKGAHKQFVHSTHSIMEWLLRIFFAAAIGFQVPVNLLKDTKVIALGAVFWATCVLIKLAVAVFVPKFQEVSDDKVAFNPYVRDVVVTGLSMTCRGELNFIIAAFALSEGVITPEMYASVVFAVLLSAITSPYVLLQSLIYFKKLQEKHLQAIKPAKGDDTKPLHLRIHLDTGNAWSLTQRICSEIRRLGLKIEDFRTSHERGLDSSVISDIYVRDPQTKLMLRTVQMEKSVRMLTSDPDYLKKLENLDSLDDHEKELFEILAMTTKEDDKIVSREKEILSHLHRNLQDLNINDVVVAEWTPWDWSHALDALSMTRPNGQEASREFLLSIFDMADVDGSDEVEEDELLKVLEDAGMSIRRENLTAMIAFIDEDRNGSISRHEWNEAIDHYFGRKTKIDTRSISMHDISFEDNVGLAEP